jgi:hypothetical protein
MIIAWDILLGVTSHAMLTESYFLTLRDKFRDKLLTATAKRMLTWTGNEPRFQNNNDNDNRLSPLHHLGCWFFTCSKKYRWKTNSQDGVVDSTCCRMLWTLGSIPAVLNILSAVALSNLYRNLSRNVKKYDRSVATIVGKVEPESTSCNGCGNDNIARLVDCETCPPNRVKG